MRCELSRSSDFSETVDPGDAQFVDSTSEFPSTRGKTALLHSESLDISLSSLDTEKKMSDAGRRLRESIRSMNKEIPWFQSPPQDPHRYKPPDHIHQPCSIPVGDCPAWSRPHFSFECLSACWGLSGYSISYCFETAESYRSLPRDSWKHSFWTKTRNLLRTRPGTPQYHNLMMKN